MSRYTDVDNLKKVLVAMVGVYADDEDYCVNLHSILRMIDKLPTVEIVYCKECRYSYMTYDGLCKYCEWEKDDEDNFIELYYSGDHFCDFGERKTE